MIYLKSFQLSPHQVRNPNAYPYHVFRNKTAETFIFEKITILYGNNGSGKSTLLNLIANKFNIQGAEKLTSPFYSLAYLAQCSYRLGDDREEGEASFIPSHSRYVKSEDILYEIKKIQQESVLREDLLVQHAKSGVTKKKLEELKHSKQMDERVEIIKFASERYSNGETSLQIFEDVLAPDGLYLLDEPETSLAPTKQIALAEEINRLARFFDCQFIIATHSPFMLGTLEAKIYNLDAPLLQTNLWSELENMRAFFEFFEKRKQEFE